MISTEAMIALNRFGLGIAPGDGARVAADPRRWLRQQTRQVPQTPVLLRDLPGSADILKSIHEARRRDPKTLRETTRRHYRESFGRSVYARARVGIESEHPFYERLVLFWSNHFTVARSKAIIGPALAAYEREAIRPHVLGRFEDLLLAAVGHAVMVAYLDNNLSMGPNSRAARRLGKSLNENLAREVLELHTLGVDGGYQQSDVTAFAKVLTGWTHGGMVPKKARRTVTGEFVFRSVLHEPGMKTVLGKTYREAGIDEGRAVLRDLARYPATARFLATKLVRHFVADDPPAAAVTSIAAVYLASEGDLGEVSRALIDLDAVWEKPLPKVKAPYELVLSTLRALAMPKPQRRDFLVPLKTLGQEPFNAPSPQGWSDRADHWLAPEGLLRRVDWLRAIGGRAAADLQPEAFLDQVLGSLASPATRRAVDRAPTVDDAIGLVLASAEFQRR